MAGSVAAGSTAAGASAGGAAAATGASAGGTVAVAGGAIAGSTAVSGTAAGGSALIAKIAAGVAAAVIAIGGARAAIKSINSGKVTPQMKAYAAKIGEMEDTYGEAQIIKISDYDKDMYLSGLYSCALLDFDGDDEDELITV